MARKMFSTNVVSQDAFREMPQSSQCLYFHLEVNSDDDGFVGSPMGIMKVLGSTQDDMKVLVAKEYVIPFESGVVCIRHHRVNNLIRKDWYRPTIYQTEFRQLMAENNKIYYLVNESLTNREQTVTVNNKLINKLQGAEEAKKEEEAEKSIEKIREDMDKLRIAMTQDKEKKEKKEDKDEE